MDPEDVHVSARPDVIDPLLRAHINSLCTALGGSHTSESGIYVLGDEALACLRDLKRWLQGFDQKLNRLDIARCMAESNLVIGDLLEILAAWPEDKTEDKYRSRIALGCVEILVPLTYPLEKKPDTMTVNHHKHMPVIEYAQAGYKKHILHHSSKRILRSFVRVALPSIVKTPDERSERDEGIIKLVLYLLRNIVIIQHPSPNETDTGEEIDREAVIEAFQESDIFHFLLAISSSIGDEFKTQDMVVMEILFHLVKGVHIERLFMDEKETVKSSSNLEHLLNMEKELKANNAPSTRHSRFGTTLWLQKQDGRRVTVSGQEVIADKALAIAKLDSTKRWKRPKFKPRVKEPANDSDMTVVLQAPGRRSLREFVETFLDCGFNPLFISVRRSLEREGPRVVQIHYRQFFYLVGWFLEVERLRRKSKPSAEDENNLGFGLIAGVLNQESLILLKKYIMEWFDMKQWTDLEAAMRCFVQILHTIQDMTLSPIEGDQEIAENIQNRLFYEQTTLDLIVAILRRYDRQPFGYLDACTELVHVHLKTLERYSKQNVHIFIRVKKQKSKRKKKVADDPENLPLHESDEEVEAEHARITKEREFNFVQYESKFLTQPCINAFTTYLGYYKELSYQQIKRAITFFHRLFVKRELEIPLYRLDILELFCRMTQGKDALPKIHPAFKETDQFARHYIKHLVRKLQSTPALYIELLFSKTNRTTHILQYGKEPQPKTSKPRQPVELEIRAGLDFNEQVGVAVSVLLNEQKDSEVNWLKEVLTKAAESRRAWENEQAARRMMQEVTLDGSESAAVSIGTVPTIDLSPDSDDHKKAISKDSKMILLLKVLGLERSGTEENGHLNWVIPSGLASDDLKERLDLLKKFTDEPPVYDGVKTAEDFIGQIESSDNDEEEDGEFMFEPNVTKVPKPQKEGKKTLKRRRKKGDAEEALDNEGLEEREAELERRREEKRKRNDEKKKQIKSSLYVNDSDDESDEERDKQFFEREKLVRQQVDKAINSGQINEDESISTMQNPGKRKRNEKETQNRTVKQKRKRTKAAVNFHDSGNEEDIVGLEDNFDSDGATASAGDQSTPEVVLGKVKRRNGKEEGESEEDEKDSQSDDNNDSNDDHKDDDTTLRRTISTFPNPEIRSAAKFNIAERDVNEEEDEDEDTPILAQKSRAKRRSAQRVDDDQDEEE